MSHMESEARLKLLQQRLGSAERRHEHKENKNSAAGVLVHAVNAVALAALYLFHLPRLKG